MNNKYSKLALLLVVTSLVGCAGVQPKVTEATPSALEVQMMETMRDMNAPTNYGL